MIVTWAPVPTETALVSAPLVTIELPFSVTVAPVSVSTPMAPAPLVAIAVPVVVMLDPAPLASSPNALSPNVVTNPPLIVVTPPVLVKTPTIWSWVDTDVSVSLATPPVVNVPYGGCYRRRRSAGRDGLQPPVVVMVTLVASISDPAPLMPSPPEPLPVVPIVVPDRDV